MRNIQNGYLEQQGYYRELMHKIEKGDAFMPREEEEDKTTYKVVLNHEEQYSIWPVDRENPPGWRDADKSGLKPECLAYIKEVWTDMRPLSLRKHMEELAKQSNL